MATHCPRWTCMPTQCLPSPQHCNHVQENSNPTSTPFWCQARTNYHWFYPLIHQDSQRKGQVASSLFLDIKGAFPSIDIKRLTHNMRKRGIPVEYTQWYLRWSSNRRMRLSFDSFYSELFSIGNGLDQGDPLLGILYLIYNWGLYCAPRIPRGQARTPSYSARTHR